ncbi:prolyl 4-hydroxylase [Chloropicon primus]|uniref:Prolyl 4-hydroxylase n=1 Tax=Chloropicon primus TaxID=1764295 RepID=A0A5B8MX71_9CHLO|nr:prolyl 4-hydroxylase [Chloropicon primus]UPR03390.1 prolyl 4-hydroxylase [Chloropicon primus]|mmetsp:Transcript_4224/g.12322  ORF Transcript_4224/g.12322 Transcript_4224/m.12322 type:complete len:474 (-) Transcript_4224:814-2235(-)|eukprot:QDZ24182.1 prolyl 4-hydroxylase [Chloropicon primus]
MGQKCTKATLQEERAKWSKRRYAEPDAGRSPARFLAPETRRAGQSLLEIPESLGQPGETSPVHYDPSSGTIFWESETMGQFIGAIAGEPGAGPKESFTLSPAFTIPSAGPNLRWRLVWSLCDCMDDSASLYLQCRNPSDKMPFCGPLHTKFTLGVVKPLGARKMVDGAAPSTNLSSYKIDMNLSHCFTKGESNWGIQEIISADDAADFVNPATGSIQVFLRLVLVCSVPPSISSSEMDYPSSKVSAEVVSEEPRIILFDNFLSKSDCEILMSLAKPDLQRSRVATGTETPSRTSHGTFLTGRKEHEPVVLKVEDKIAQCLKRAEVLKYKSGYRKPLIKSEALQVVRYRKGEFYNEHYDNKAGNASHRAATFMIYLSDVAGGGATYFPRSTGRPSTGVGGREGDQGHQDQGSKGHFWHKAEAPPGLRIYPKQGRAVLFWSRLTTGNEDMASIHAAEAVLEGEKWIMTRWMREVE